MKTIHLLLAAALALGGTQAIARTPVPVVNHEDVVLARPGGKQPTAAEVQQAILAAAQATGRKWTISEATPGQMVASYQVRSHTVVADLRYTASHLSVSYKESVNMKYGVGPTGAPVIHPFYNQWVNEFIQAIRVELAKN